MAHISRQASGMGETEGKITLALLMSAPGTLATSVFIGLFSSPQLPPGVEGSPVLSTLEWHWLQLCSTREIQVGQREGP